MVLLKLPQHQIEEALRYPSRESIEGWFCYLVDKFCDKSTQLKPTATKVLSVSDNLTSRLSYFPTEYCVLYYYSCLVYLNLTKPKYIFTHLHLKEPEHAKN